MRYPPDTEATIHTPIALYGVHPAVRAPEQQCFLGGIPAGQPGGLVPPGASATKGHPPKRGTPGQAGQCRFIGRYHTVGPRFQEALPSNPSDKPRPPRSSSQLPTHSITRGVRLTMPTLIRGPLVHRRGARKCFAVGFEDHPSQSMPRKRCQPDPPVGSRRQPLTPYHS